MFWQAKNARFWIAGLRQRRDGADFDMTKTKLHRAIKTGCILVKTSRQPKRVGKFKPASVTPKLAFVDSAAGRGPRL
jgi:hypothetical protein